MNYVGRRISKAIKQILLYSVLGVVLVAFMIPTYWIVSTSLKVPKDIMAMPPRLVFAPTFANYAVTLLGKEDVTVTGGHATSDTAFPKYVLDSAVISLGATLLALLLGTPAAYALARMRFPGKRSLAYFTFLIRLLPSIGLIIPMYIMFSKLKLLDSYLGLILAYLTFNLSFVIWMMKSFIEELPIALEDAALVDGCTRLGLIVRIILPISLPGLGATTIYSIILCWNEFMIPLILGGTKVKAVTVAIYSFIGVKEIVWGSLAAGATAITVPVLVMILLVQRSLVRGLTMGATKG